MEFLGNKGFLGKIIFSCFFNPLLASLYPIFKSNSHNFLERDIVVISTGTAAYRDFFRFVIILLIAELLIQFTYSVFCAF